MKDDYDILEAPLTKDKSKFASKFKKYENTIRYDKFKDDFDLMSCLYGDGKFPAFKRDIDAWYATYSRETAASTSTCSPQNRRLGNDAFAKMQLKSALCFYTKAILQAGNNKEQLALAHANRAVALQKIGDYQAAYEDGECARLAGYPANSLAKVIMRQAYCAFKLGRMDKLREHLNEVSAEVKETHFKEAMLEYEAALAAHDAAATAGREEEPAVEGPQEEPHTEIKKLIWDLGYRLVISKDLQKDELLFTDRAVALMPVDGKMFCQNCASLLHTPFPCNECQTLAQYCSLACRSEHAAVHRHECRLFSSGLYKSFGPMSHLAMRVLLAELPELLKVLREVRSPQEWWTELRGAGKRITMDTSLGRSLLAPVNMMRIEKKLRNEMTVHTLVIMRYLESIGSVQSLFSDNGFQFADMKIVIAALCMRRITQLLSFCQTILCPSLPIKQDENILDLKFWTEQPKHLARGTLHKLHTGKLRALAYMPLANYSYHSCDADLMQITFDGREMRTYALRPYEKGEPIERRHTYYSCIMQYCEDFEIDIEALTRRNNQILRQRCEWCNQEFAQEIYENLTQLVPDALVDLGKRMPKPCPACHREQPAVLANQLSLALSFPISTRAHRAKIIRLFDRLNTVYLALHCVKLIFGDSLVWYFLNILKGYPVLSAEGIDKICKIILYGIQWRKTYEPESLEYTCSLFALLDMIALGYYEPKRKFIETMLRAVSTLSPDFKDIVMNYYNDYIKPLTEDTPSEQGVK